MQYVETLKAKELKATPQRICILKILGKHTHPTIDELYNDMREIYPSISLATVYKNLNTLIDKGVVIEVAGVNQKSKFDLYEKPHIHAICSNCGRVVDYYDDMSKIEEYQNMLEKNIGTIIDRLSIVATTIDCKHCR